MKGIEYMKNDVVEAIIEIPYRSRNKYEIDHDTGKVKLDRVLYSAMAYPAEYGFLENTLANDGDPLDILVIGTERTYPGCIVPARIIGYLKVIDRGFEDYKLISVVDVDPRYEEVKELTDLSRFILDEIKIIDFPLCLLIFRITRLFIGNAFILLYSLRSLLYNSRTSLNNAIFLSILSLTLLSNI